MKPSIKRTLGVVIIVLSMIAAAIGLCQIFPFTFDDFPCIVDEESLKDIKSDTRLAYCIREWPLLEAKRRGKVYDHGASNQNEITVGELALKRDGQMLLINGCPLAEGEIYRTTQWKISVNPWLIFTTRFKIENYGLITTTGNLESVDVLYASGDVYDGWCINPLGPILLGYGICLFRQGKPELKRKSQFSTEAG